jgi:hypothetical protein
MKGRDFRITVFILVIVVGIAFWSRLRYMDREGYDQPLRWKLDEHPALQQRNKSGN